MRNAAGLPQGNVKWKPVRLGGVGFHTGYSLSADGVTHAVRIDVFGGVIKSTGDTIWRQAFTSASLAIGDCPGTAGYVVPVQSLLDNLGCNELVVAPNNNQILYAVWNARLWKSTNAGKNWTHLTGVADFLSQSNSGGQPHNHGPNIAVDPQNASVFLLGTQANGLYYSTNGGTTITNVALGSNSTINGYQPPSKVACDPTSTVTSTVKQRWFAVRQGTGVHVSTTGPGGTYTLMTGSPTYVGDLVFDSLGNCWATDPTNASTNNLWKCAAGGTTWVKSPNSAPMMVDYGVAIAVDPLVSGHVTVFADTGYSYSTQDSGATWSSVVTNINLYAYTLPWLGGGHTSSITIGSAKYDPVTSGKVWASTGIGMYSCPYPYGTTTVNWTECTEGSECSDANNMIEPLNGAPIFCIWDQGAWRMDDLDHSWRGYANRTPTGAFASSVQAAWDVDVASDNPLYVATLINFGGQWSGYSTDGWSSCQKFATDPPLDFIGGCICCGPQGNILINQTGGDHGNWGAPYYTKNGGSSWGYINAPGVTTSFTGHIDNGSGSAGTTVTVTAMNFGTIVAGMAVTTGAGNNGNGSLGYISGQVSGAAGGVGVYTLSASALVTSRTLIATTGGFGGSADYVNRKNAAYDALAGKYYMTNCGTNDGPIGDFSANAGIWSTSDLAGAWAKAYSGNIWSLNGDFWSIRLKWVPGHQGHFFVCGSNTAGSNLKRSTDGCVSLQDVVNVTDVWDIVFGASAPGQSYPAIYFGGKVSGVLGIYRSDDNFATTAKFLTAFPGNSCDGLGMLGASPNKYGRIYIGLEGSGWMYADYDCPITLT